MTLHIIWEKTFYFLSAMEFDGIKGVQKAFW